MTTIAEYIREKQPQIYKKIQKKYKLQQKGKESKHNRDYVNYKELMSTEHVYKRGRGGAYRQIK